MKKTIDIADVSAKGVVSNAIVDIPDPYHFESGEVHALSSECSIGDSVSLATHSDRFDNLTDVDFTQVELPLFCAGGNALTPFVPKAAETSCPKLIKKGGGSGSAPIGHIRNVISYPKSLNLWTVSNNVRKGEALNRIQNAEFLLKSYF